MKAEDALRSIPCANPQEKAYFDLHFYRYADTLTRIPEARITGATVLDVGTLPCHMPVALKKMGASRAIGLDYAPDRFGAQKEFESRGVEIKTCDVAIDPFPLESDSVDTCLFNEVIEHFEKGPEYCLGEVRRVMKKDGLLVLTTPNVDNLANRIRCLLGKPLYVPEKGLKGKQLHHHEYSMGELLGVLKAAGFTITDFGYVAGSEKALIHGTFPTRMPRIFSLMYALVPLAFPKLRSYLCVVIKK